MKARMRSATVSGAAILLFASLPAMAQRAYIDPATGQLTTPPAGAAKRAPDTPMPTMEAKRNAQGYEYLDTSGYRMVTRAHLDENGDVELTCEHGVTGHAHEVATHENGEAP